VRCIRTFVAAIKTPDLAPAVVTNEVDHGPRIVRPQVQFVAQVGLSSRRVHRHVRRDERHLECRGIRSNRRQRRHGMTDEQRYDAVRHELADCKQFPFMTLV